ncbi:MAG: DNA-binding protein [Chloroflexi bacterium]|nr:DNA-binding protein [Chloroflexota bacterium]
MEYYEDFSTGIVIVALRRGDLLFESIERVAREADVHSGVLMSGIGSLTRAHIHTVRSTDYPPREEYFQLRGALEIVQFGGIIANYQPHLHISLWDERRNYFGGHVHEGCEILTLSEISIHRLKDLRLTRRALDTSGVGLLTRA